MGTPEFAATILDELTFQHEVCAVYTRPDAVRGRGRALVASPVKQVAEKHNIDVLTPKSLRDQSVFDELKSYEPEVIVVAAYGAILPARVLKLPKFGCVNVHASALPRWRGAAPIERAILAGDTFAGVCIMRMGEGLDTGDFCVSRQVEIAGQTSTELTARLADLGACALLSALSQIESGTCTWTHQDESLVTYANKIEKAELNLNPEDCAGLNVRRVQASSEPHPAKCMRAGKTCTILAASNVPASEVLSLNITDNPGALTFVAKRLFATCASDTFEILSVKPDGKREMTAKEFVAGAQQIRQPGATWSAV
jgi:methionyl-tRNA formyltransferase